MEFAGCDLDPYSRLKPMLRDLMCPILYDKSEVTDFFDLRRHRFIRIPIKNDTVECVTECLEQFNNLTTEIYVTFKYEYSVCVKTFYYKNDNINLFTDTPHRVIKVADIIDEPRDENIIVGKYICQPDHDYYLDIFFSDNFYNHRYIKQHNHTYKYSKTHSYLFSFNYDTYLMYEYNIISYYEKIPRNIEAMYHKTTTYFDELSVSIYLPIIIVCSHCDHVVTIDGVNITTNTLIYAMDDDENAEVIMLNHVVNKYNYYNRFKLRELDIKSSVQDFKITLITLDKNY